MPGGVCELARLSGVVAPGQRRWHLCPRIGVGRGGLPVRWGVNMVSLDGLKLVPIVLERFDSHKESCLSHWDEDGFWLLL